MILPPLDEVDGPVTDGLREAWRLIEENLAQYEPFQPDDSFIYTFEDAAVSVVFDEDGDLETVAVDDHPRHFSIRLRLNE